MDDYDNMLDSWENGNRVVVVAAVVNLSRSELWAFGELFLKRFGTEEYAILERFLMRFDNVTAQNQKAR